MAAIICMHEDRTECLTGVKLGILSLRRHSPSLGIVLNSPTAPPAFVEWARRIPQLTLASYTDIRDHGWNMKPHMLLRLLQEGYPEVIWMDADIIAHRDVLTPLTRLAPEVLVATQETYWGQSQGGTERTRAWGFTPGRVLPCTVNSGVLRVTTKHLGLLKAWESLLQHPLYRRAQSLPWYERPLHMISDQEVLTGMLGAEEFSSTPLHLLKRGSDIAQCMGPGGFTPAERIRSITKGLPGLVHSMAIKPWMKEARPPALNINARSLRRYYEYLHMELTPYASVARSYAPELDEDVQWLNLNSSVSKLLAIVTGNSAVLRELPLSIVDSLARRWRRWRGVARYELNEEFCLTESPLSQASPPGHFHRESHSDGSHHLHA